MPSKEKLDEMRTEIEQLVTNGNSLLSLLAEHQNDKKDKGSFILKYQPWYTRSLPVVKQLLPDRYDEFAAYYNREKRKEISYESYTINDYMLGLVISRGGQPVFSTLHAAHTKLTQQVMIVACAGQRLDSAVADIR